MTISEELAMLTYWSEDLQKAVKERTLTNKESLPTLYRSIYNRRYQLPARLQNTYHDLRLVQALDFKVVFEWACRKLIPNPSLNKNSAIRYLMSLAGLETGFPTRFLDLGLLPLLQNTVLPDSLDFDDLKLPYPFLRVMLPKGIRWKLEKEIELSSLQIAYIESGLKTLPDPVSQELEQLAQAVHFKAKGLDAVGIKDENVLVVKATGSNGAEWIMPARSLRDFNSKVDPAGEELFRLGLNIGLFMSQVPKVANANLPPGDRFIGPRKMKGNGRVLPELYHARFVGESFDIPPLPASHQHRTEGKPSYHIRPHWRRGHWKRVAHGSKHSLRRLQWIYPTAINWGENEKV
jgi:hypothetical protein